MEGPGSEFSNQHDQCNTLIRQEVTISYRLWNKLLSLYLSISSQRSMRLYVFTIIWVYVSKNLFVYFCLWVYNKWNNDQTTHPTRTILVHILSIGLKTVDYATWALFIIFSILGLLFSYSHTCDPILIYNDHTIIWPVFLIYTQQTYDHFKMHFQTGFKNPFKIISTQIHDIFFINFCH